MKRVLAMLLSTSMLTGCGLFTSSQNDVEKLETIRSEATTQMEVPEVTEFTPIEAVYTSEEISGNFNAAFIKEALKNEDNVIVSPLSAKMVVNIAAMGADENSVTQQELLNLFGYGSVNEMKGDSKNLMDELNRENGTLTTNNSYWKSDKLAEINPDYAEQLEAVFRAESYSADLTSAEFVNDLNSWVEKNTNGLIPKLLDESLDSSARLVLVNTLYFNNKWVNKFEGFATYDKEFYGNKGTENVPTMHQGEIYLDYGEGNKFKSVTMPYRDGSVMNIYLPKDEDANIADIIKEMSLDKLTEELEAKREEKMVNIAMPKFECDYSGSLKEMLQLLGVNKAFDPYGAEFNSMTEDEQLYISKIIQAAKIICDEEGTEAAAATMAVMTDGCALIEEQPIDFIVDRPFMYEIKSPSGETLFMGVIQNFND
ncbi:MAG: hypothetical protein IKK42_06860 [Oscillospiraceae bacterium]|nr:hypothetical protein [Oscillospiraceae bacterium]